MWAYDFVACRTEDGRAVRMLTVIDEYTRECLAIFYSLKEVEILTEQWRQEYNTSRPHSPLGYRPPVPEAIMPRLQLVANPR